MSTDAEVLVDRMWLRDWLELFDDRPALALTGTQPFEREFDLGQPVGGRPTTVVKGSQHAAPG